MASSPGKLTRMNTDWVDAEQRLSYWEESCRSALVGLRCSSHAVDGLRAEQSLLDLDVIRVGKVQGNAHVIERTPALISAYPTESIFANLLLDDDTFLYQRGRGFNLHRGDVILYDARMPYLLGCGDHIHQFHVDVSTACFRERVAKAGLDRPIHISGSSGAAKVYGAALRNLLARTLAAVPPDISEAGALQAQVCDLLASMVHVSAGRAPHSALGASHVLAAKAYIEDHLGDESMTAADVALAISVSERHLRRLFSQQDTSLVEYMLSRRLINAHGELADPVHAHLGVAEVAYRWGFVSAAHFSRVFKARFGLTPSALRAAGAPRTDH